MTRLQERPDLSGRDGTLQAAAAEGLRLAALDPAAARAISIPVLEPARRLRAWDIVSTAERALGVAAMNLCEIDVAIPHLRAAVAAGHRAGSPSGAGEARMSLASALVLRGLPRQASREIETAVRELDGIPAARASVQHAAILQELGKDDAALRELRRALPVLRRAGDGEWAARALSNRSLIHASRRSFGAAETDLLEARSLCDEHDLELPAAYAEQNLGCVKARRGDVPDSLRHFDAAEERYRRFGLVKASVYVDRAEVLLSVRLLDEARSTAEAAVTAFQQQRRDVHVPEAQLLLSTVALLQGETSIAAQSAAAAAHGFRRLGRLQWLALARYAVIQAQAAHNLDSVSPAKAARAADALEQAGWKVPALEARVLAGRIALDQGRRTVARRQLSLASRARFTGPADARSRAWLAEALLRRADGRRPAALSALRAGLQIVEDHQATLGATELRAHVSVHRGTIARWGLRMALEDADARRALWWAERGRASALFIRPVQPPEDPALALDLADLRQTMTRIEQARGDGEPDAALVHRQVALERSIRDRCRTLNGRGGDEERRRRDSVGDLIAPLGDAAIASYTQVDGNVYAITVAAGRVRLHSLGSPEAARRELAFMPFALRRLAKPADGATAHTAAARTLLRRAATVLDDLLLRPLRAELRDRPLVIVPTGTLQSLPWSILPSCAGRPVTVSPSITMWHEAVQRPKPDPGAPVVVVAGPGLPGAHGEALEIAGMYPGSILLTDDAANAGGLAESMKGARMLHLAAHGSIRSDNALFSSLTLADGPFTVYELERLARPPHQVILAACDTGRAHVVAGDEILGFGAALLAGGTATLVAPVVPVPDAETAALMRAYHEGLRHCSPAEALARAQSHADSADTASWAAAAGFVCMGAG